MSYKLQDKALLVDGLEPIEKLVLIAYAKFADDKTGECWPSQGTIAKKIVKRSRRIVNETTQSLCEKGVMTKIGYHGRTVKYKVLPPVTTGVTGQKKGKVGFLAPPVTTGVTGSCKPRGYTNLSRNQSTAEPSLEELIGPIPTNPAERRAWAVNLVRHCYPVWQAWEPIVSSMTASLPPLEAKDIEAVCEDTWEYLAAKDSSARLPTLEAMAM